MCPLFSLLMFSQNLSSIKYFSQNPFCGSLGIILITGRNTGRSKVAYSWISPDPAKAGPTLGRVVVVVVVVHQVDNIQLLAGVLGCTVDSFPTYYLGLPLGAKYKNKSIWKLSLIHI